MITDMLAKLEQKTKDDATEKAYCDEQMAKTEAKRLKAVSQATNSATRT